ncbi:hypothetical protein MPER_08087, partial [Moniliophthora perniciosa FA553]
MTKVDSPTLNFRINDQQWLSMASTISAPTSSNSSDYFEPEDSQFLEVLGKTRLPGDLSQTSADSHQEEAEEDPEEPSASQQRSTPYVFDENEPPPSTQPSLKRRFALMEETKETGNSENGIEEDEAIYGAAHFGDFGEYMRRKRAKLQHQNAGIVEGETSSKIFDGISIY